jgi:hypothetical protein
LYPVAGCKIYIGEAVEDADADLTEADFSATAWVEIGKWSQMGDFGDTAQLITSQLINEGRDKKMKGTKNGGQMQNVFAVAATDPGQIALIAASKTDKNYPIKIEMNDKPAVGASPKNGERLFYALIMNANETGGGPNTVRNLNSTFEINSNIVTVAPSAT